MKFEPQFTNGHRAPRAAQERIPLQVPILGAPKLPVWRCLNGHEHRGVQPFRLPLWEIAPGQILYSGPCCPFCLGNWMGTEFAVAEVVPEADGGLNPAKRVES